MKHQSVQLLKGQSFLFLTQADEHVLQLRGQGLDLVLVLNHLCVLSDPVQTDSCPYEPQQNSLTAVTCADCLRYPWEATSKLEGPGATLPHPAPCMSLTRESIEELLRQLHAAQCSTKGWLTPY